MSWFNESKRHSDARKGIKTAQKLPMTVDINIKRYMGKWYEIASIPAWFQQGCKKAMAEYEAKNGKVKVTNSCIRDGKRDFAYATAVKTGKGKLEVDFGIPFVKGDYWVLYVDEGYQNAIVGTPDRKYLWFLSRTPTISQKKYSKFKNIARGQGFDVQMLKKN